MIVNISVGSCLYYELVVSSHVGDLGEGGRRGRCRFTIMVLECRDEWVGEDLGHTR